MDLSQAFILQVRQYAALEERMHRDFSAPIEQFAREEIQRLIAAGVPSETALAEVNAFLDREVVWYPVVMEGGLG